METPVIDFHCHVGSWGRFWMDDDVELFLRALDRAGISAEEKQKILGLNAKRLLNL